MKKNLRIVSAAAAALLAVAPVAATAVVSAPTATVQATDAKTKTVATKGDNTFLLKKNANGKWEVAFRGGSDLPKNTTLTVGTTLTPLSNADAKALYGGTWMGNNGLSLYEITSGQFKGYYVQTGDVTVLNTPSTPSTPSTTPSDKINAGSSSIFDADANTVVSISAVAATAAAPSSINGNIVYTDAQGQSHTALLHGVNGINATVYKETNNGSSVSLKPVSNVKELEAGRYLARLHDVTVNLGNAAAGTSVTFTLGKGSMFKSSAATNNGRTLTVPVDNNGVAHLGEIDSEFWAYDSQDLQEVHFYSVKTGNVVTSGSVDLHARANDGMLNVNSVFAALTQEYRASQLDGHKNVDQLLPVNDIRDQLKKQNVTVDPNGYFKAPASFTINFNAKSNNNGATASLPVTVNVDNAQASNNAAETTKTVTIMHISTIYDKNGKATHEPALRAYDTYSVVATPVNLKDEKGKDAGMFYKLAGKDQYIKVGNVDGTSRSLKHNSYVYKSTGKRNGKKVLKKGSSVTTYGKSFMIAGHQMYRIGKNQYVKKANF